jgi:hypothetical protein
MSDHELEKLLGGFAADTLTPEERQKLFAAALQDQQLFNALADEQALKELLTDPAVRRRLLQALEQKGTADAGGALSWLDWFKRPAGLAFAGGLAAAVFAVVLGTKIYQDSLNKAAQSIATEEAKPSAPTPVPPTAPLAQPLNEKAEVKAKKDARPDKTAKKERGITPPSSQEGQASDVAQDEVTRRSEQDEAHKQAEFPAASLGKATEEAPTSADQKPLVQSSTPPAAAPEPARTQAPAGIAAPAAGIPTTSARALFYAGEPGRFDKQAFAEKEQRLRAFSESAPQANRPERKLDRLAAAGKVTQFMLLGLRYSFVARGDDGQDREVDKATAAGSAGQAHLTVESNQDAYLQIWKTVETLTPQLVFPEKDSGQISTKILAGQRQVIPLPTESGPVTLTARLSRVPFGPIRRQEAAMLDRPSLNQLQESITSSSPVGTQENATYVVNQDPSPNAQLIVEIPLSQ